jgi:hypothetical protein
MEFRFCKCFPSTRCGSVSAYVSSGEQRESPPITIINSRQYFTPLIAQSEPVFLTNILNMFIAPDFSGYRFLENDSVIIVYYHHRKTISLV